MGAATPEAVTSTVPRGLCGATARPPELAETLRRGWVAGPSLQLTFPQASVHLSVWDPTRLCAMGGPEPLAL